MRSTTSSHRRRHDRSGPVRRVDAVAHVVDEGTADHPDHVLVHVEGDGDDPVLGLTPLPAGAHPFVELAGFTAPAEWSMFGVRVRGTAHHLDGHHPPTPTRTTFLVDRAGEESSLLRTDDGTRPLPGPATGTIPDLCRRVLGVATAPAPPSTAPLWTVAWVDRVVEGLGDPARRAGLTASWARLAGLHPAVDEAADDAVERLADPAHLVALARAHTEAWSWARLRADPDALLLPHDHLPGAITTWMDDGFYARWALGAFPEPTALVHDLVGLLDPRLRRPLIEVLEGVVTGPGQP